MGHALIDSDSRHTGPAGYRTGPFLLRPLRPGFSGDGGMPTSDEPAPDAEQRTAAPQLRIRGTRPADCEAIAALINLPGVRYNTLRLPFETPEAVRRRLEARASPDTSVVALLGDELVGWADMHRFDGRRAHVGELGMSVLTDNQRALGLYRRFGFAVEGTLRAYALRDGVLRDAHCMARLV